MVLSVNEMPTLSLLYKQGNIPSPRVPDGPDPDSYTAKATFNDKICLIQHDITKLEVDAIVNAANNRLLGGGGVDGAIHAAARASMDDDRLYKACKDLKGCDTGDAKVTDGYALPAKRIIHAVGPIFSSFHEGECRALLKSCYRKCLEIAVSEGLKSIAFSALSTGIYGYPSTKASEAALETVRDFLETGKADGLEHIVFCNFMDKDVDAYYGVIAHYFPPVTEAAKATSTDNEEPKVASTDEADPKAALTDEAERASKLPDAPTADPQDTSAPEEPMSKKQKTDVSDDDFVVVEKGDAVGAESAENQG